jgi:TPR repeat protein
MMAASQTADDLFNKADQFEEKGQLRRAFACLLRASQLGDSSSQVNLGNFYALGTGTRKDLEKAAYWYKRAYRSGDSTGAFNLAIDKRNAGNKRSAIIWFKKALDMRYGEAAAELAKIYMQRPGGKKLAIAVLKKTRGMNCSEISEAGREEVAELLSKLSAR